jgi:hypothetical protein
MELQESLKWAGAEERRASKSSRVLYLFGKQSKTEAAAGWVHSALCKSRFLSGARLQLL